MRTSAPGSRPTKHKSNFFVMNVGTGYEYRRGAVPNMTAMLSRRFSTLPLPSVVVSVVRPALCVNVIWRLDVLWGVYGNT